MNSEDEAYKIFIVCDDGASDGNREDEQSDKENSTKHQVTKT